MSKLKETVEKVNEILKSGEPDNIQEITTPDKRTLYGYKPQSIIDALNEVYPNWKFKFSILSVEKPEDKKAFHSVVQVWIEIEEIERTHIGQSTNMNKGDSIKGAVTDGIAKTLSLFSIGNRAFLGELQSALKGKSQSKGKQSSQNSRQKSSKTISEKQAKRLFAIMREQGYSREAIEKWLNAVGLKGFGDIELDRYNAIVNIIETGDGDFVIDALKVKVYYKDRNIPVDEFIEWCGEDDLEMLLEDEKLLDDTIQAFKEETSLSLDEV